MPRADCMASLQSNGVSSSSCELKASDRALSSLSQVSLQARKAEMLEPDTREGREVCPASEGRGLGTHAFPQGQKGRFGVRLGIVTLASTHTVNPNLFQQGFACAPCSRSFSLTLKWPPRWTCVVSCCGTSFRLDGPVRYCCVCA